MVESLSLNRLFAEKIAQIFSSEGFEVRREVTIGRDRGYDLYVVSPSGKTAIVELKIYRTRILSPDIVTRLIDQVESYRRSAQVDRGVLITLSRIPYWERRAPNQRLVIFDYNALRSLSAKKPRLALELEALAREVLITPTDLTPEVVDSSEMQPVSLDVLDRPLSEDEWVPPPPQIEPPESFRGTDLCRDIRRVRKGRQGAQEFEKRVEAALKYVFETDLSAWSTQKNTHGGISRYDVIARISSTHDMWRMLVERFHSQYVVFEFKNLRAKVKQGEIYTTEKYLYTKALRTTAFVISHNGADTNALVAARGALREHGKLIINLNVDDICTMLALKDDRQDHNVVILEIIDQMLMTLER